MLEELASLEESDTWDLVGLPDVKRAIGYKWVFKRKQYESDNVVRFKVGLVARGFSQSYATDYDEGFAPVVRHTTFRTMISVSAKRKMHVKQFDVKTAFLNGNLEEKIFMKQPPGLVVSGMEGKAQTSGALLEPAPTRDARS